MQVIEEVMSTAAASSDDFDGLPPYVDPNPIAHDLKDAKRCTVEAWRTYLRPGLGDLEAGRTLEHEEFMRQMRERYRSRNAA